MHIDLHTHTAIGSDCSEIQPTAMVTAAIEAGLDAICITDHVFHGLTLRHDPHRVFAGFRATHQAAAASGVLVLPGIEFSFNEGDFLVFGLDETVLPELGESYSLQTCLALAHRENGVVVQAHPFRYGGQPTRLVDAIETLNGGNSDEHNRLAAVWSQANGMVALAGSDAHEAWQVGRCYTVFDGPCASVTDLCQAIRQRRVRRLVHRHRQ